MKLFRRGAVALSRVALQKPRERGWHEFTGPAMMDVRNLRILAMRGLLQLLLATYLFGSAGIADARTVDVFPMNRPAAHADLLTGPRETRGQPFEILVHPLAVTGYGIGPSESPSFVDSGNGRRIGSSCEIAADVADFRSKERFEDFEIAVDPTDPDFDLIVAANRGRSGPELSDIVVARLDGVTGLLSGMPRIIASNYAGYHLLNGPEFAFHETIGLGVLFAGPRGVHAAWRPLGSAWHGFRADVHGVPFARREPPALPGTTGGRHPGGSPPFDLLSYPEIFGRSGDRCEELCYGHFTDLTRTDFAPALRDAVGLELIVSTPHPADSGYVIFNACPSASRRNNCGLYEIRIDGAGGVETDTLTRLTPSAFDIRYMLGQGLRAAVHPGTGNLVVYGLRSGNFDIWESDRGGVALSLVGSLPGIAEDAGHTRVIEGSAALYLHFIVRDGPERGSYVSVFAEDPLPPVWISRRPGGTELVYFPAIDRLGLYYWKGVTDPDGDEHQLLVRCWVD